MSNSEKEPLLKKASEENLVDINRPGYIFDEDDQYLFDSSHIGIMTQMSTRKIHERQLALGAKIKDLADKDIDIDEILDLETNLHMLNLALTKRDDKIFDDLVDIIYPIAHLVPTLSIFACYLATLNIVFIPLFILIYSTLYLSMNIKRNSFFNSGNIILALTALTSLIVTIFSGLVFFGIAQNLAPIIIPSCVVLNILIFCIGLYREIKRDIEARRIVSENINIALKEFKLIINKLNMGPEEEEKNLLQTKYFFLSDYIKILSRENANLVRTIKNPISKYLTHYQDCLKRNKNILEIVGKKSPLSISVDKDQKNIEKYLRRDTVWFSINIGIVTISILLFIPFIPITLSAPVLIATLSLALASGLGNIALRIYDRNFGNIKEHPIELDNFENKNETKTELKQTKMKFVSELSEKDNDHNKEHKIKNEKK